MASVKRSARLTRQVLEVAREREVRFTPRALALASLAIDAWLEEPLPGGPARYSNVDDRELERADETALEVARRLARDFADREVGFYALLQALASTGHEVVEYGGYK